jgi:lantibiotic modifying enzyme
MYRIKQNSEQHEDLQKEHIEYFKNMQVKMEKDKKRYDDILNAVLDPEDLKEATQIQSSLEQANTITSVPNPVEQNIKPKRLLKVVDDVD